MRNHPYMRWGVIVVLSVFVVAALLRFSASSGDDLSSSYVGCRLVATGQSAHLYHHDPVDFSAIGTDDLWQQTADAAHFDGELHPYVQTPLWAWGLKPLCMRTDFAQFQRVFAVFSVLCFAASVWMIAWFWTPRLLHPAVLAVVLAALWFSVPFQYAMALMQTHVLFFAMTLAALILAERGRPGWAGLLLAGAAAVKLTPAVLLIYWLLTRRWKAAASLALWSAAIYGFTVHVAGPPLMADYLAGLHRISRVLLVTENNQSFAAWWMGHFYPDSIVDKIDILPLPTPLRLGSTALMAAFTALGGIIDRRRTHGFAPVGAMMALVASTVFAPIAWTHYSIILVARMMVLAQENLWLRRPWLWVAMAVVVALNFPPLAADVPNWAVGPYAVLRSEFYAAVICLGVLGWVGFADSSRMQITREPRLRSNLEPASASRRAVEAA